MYRITLHGEAGWSRATEEQLVQAFEAFVRTVEQIEGHAVTLAQFEGQTGFHRHRGEDTTMVETPVQPAAPPAAQPFDVAP